MRTLALIVVSAFVTATASHAYLGMPPRPAPTDAPPAETTVPPPVRPAEPVAAPRPAAVAPPRPTVSGTNQPLLTLTVNLKDGSRLCGSTKLTAFSLQSGSLGNLTVSLDRIRTVKFSQDRETVTVTLQNGDRLQAALRDTAVALTTLFGLVSIPMDKVTDVAIESGGAGGNLKAGLVAYYPFNGDANDHSGHDNHGKVVGGAEFEAVGLRFKGNNTTYVLVPRSDSLEPAEAITISMWVKGVPGQEAGQGWGMVLHKTRNCGPGYLFRGGGITQFDLDGPNPCGGHPATSAQFRRFSETRWQHIAGTYSPADGAVKSYQDGELVNQAPRTEPLAHSGDLYIGGSTVSPDYGGFRGVIAEVRIYNRVLSAEEIRALRAREPGGR